MAKEKNIPVKIDLIEKSPKKVQFLKSIISDLKLKMSVHEQDVNVNEAKLIADVIVLRAFKPLEIISITLSSVDVNSLFVFSILVILPP